MPTTSQHKDTPTAQLLTTILASRSETPAQRLLELAPIYMIPQLNAADYKSLNLTMAQGERLAAAIEFGRRLWQTPTPVTLPKLTSPKEVAAFISDMAQLQQEHLRVICLNARNRVVHKEDIYRGNVNTTIIRGAEVFRPAIIRNAPAIIVAHNHPSGDPKPSPEDLTITTLLFQLGQELHIEVLDHMIIGPGMNYQSIRETHPFIFGA